MSTNKIDESNMEQQGESSSQISQEPQHRREEILEFMQTRKTAVIATSAGETLRLRMMHLGVEDDFTIYLASMRNDPKVIQMTNHPSVSILMNHIPADITQAEEVEYTGKALIIRDPDERRRCLETTAKTSPIVKALKQQNNTGVLDCIKIVPQLAKYRKFAEIVQGMPPTVVEFPQNRRAVSDWSLLATKLKNWWTAVRFNSLAASLVPVLLGTAIAFYETGTMLWGWFLVTLLAAVALQAGTNVVNDYYDHYSGNDRKNLGYIRPFSGGSRVIQLGLLTPLELLVGSMVLCGGALAAGTYFALSGRPWVTALALTGLLSGVLYNRGGWNLLRSGLGEVFIGLNFGPLITLGAYYVQAGRLAWAPLAASVPIAILITAVIFINEFQDIDADRATNKPTWVSRIGREQAARLLPVFFGAAGAFLVLGVVVGHAPVAVVLALLATPLAYRASVIARDHYDNGVDLAPANGFTALTHLAFGLLQVLGYVAQGLGEHGIAVTIVLAVLFGWFTIYMHQYTERLRLASISVRQAMAR